MVKYIHSKDEIELPFKVLDRQVLLRAEPRFYPREKPRSGQAPFKPLNGLGLHINGNDSAARSHKLCHGEAVKAIPTTNLKCCHARPDEVFQRP